MEVQEEGDAYLIMIRSHCCMAETNTALQISYPPIQIFFLKKKGPGGLFKAQTAGPNPRVSASVGLQ